MNRQSAAPYKNRRMSRQWFHKRASTCSFVWSSVVVLLLQMIMMGGSTMITAFHPVGMTSSSSSHGKVKTHANQNWYKHRYEEPGISRPNTPQYDSPPRACSVPTTNNHRRCRRGIPNNHDTYRNVNVALASTLVSRGGGGGVLPRPDDYAVEPPPPPQDTTTGQDERTPTSWHTRSVTTTIYGSPLLWRMIFMLLAAAVVPILYTGITATPMAKYVWSGLFSISMWSSMAPFCSIGLKLSPMPTLLQVRTRQTTGGLPLLPYSAMATMTFVLVLYGILVRDPKIALTHSIGHVISLFYCMTFIKHCPPGVSNLPGTISIHKKVSGAIVTMLLVAVAIWGRGAASLAGWTSLVLSCIMYAGPLTVLNDALQTKSAENIPLPYAMASFLNSIAWTVYGFFQRDNDILIWFPGLIGIVSSTAQIFLNLLYYRPKTKTTTTTKKAIQKPSS